MSFILLRNIVDSMALFTSFRALSSSPLLIGISKNVTCTAFGFKVGNGAFVESVASFRTFAFVVCSMTSFVGFMVRSGTAVNVGFMEGLAEAVVDDRTSFWTCAVVVYFVNPFLYLYLCFSNSSQVSQHLVRGYSVQ